jgi:hypothetical protein
MAIRTKHVCGLVARPGDFVVMRSHHQGVTRPRLRHLSTGGTHVQLKWISADGVSAQPVDAAAELLARSDGLVWLDIPTWDEAAEHVLRDVFAFHPMAISDCTQRNQVPKVHVYPDQRPDPTVGAGGRGSVDRRHVGAVDDLGEATRLAVRFIEPARGAVLHARECAPAHAHGPGGPRSRLVARARTPGGGSWRRCSDLRPRCVGRRHRRRQQPSTFFRTTSAVTRQRSRWVSAARTTSGTRTGRRVVRST